MQFLKALTVLYLFVFLFCGHHFLLEDLERKIMSAIKKKKKIPVPNLFMTLILKQS